jgi:hypothetical protein
MPFTAPPERLSSGVWLAGSPANAVFVSGGALTRFAHELTAGDVKAFQQYRPDRILVLAPASSLARARQLWTSFKGSSTGETTVSRGKVSSGDLPALLILETILELNTIQAGWWPEVSLRIDAGQGSELQIVAPDAKRTQIAAWIKALATSDLPDAFFSWAREVAVHRFEKVLPDLQALTWERDPQGLIQHPETVSSSHVKDVARIYF